MPPTRAYLYQLERVKGPPSKQRQGMCPQPGAWRRRCLDFSPRQWELLSLLLAHPLLDRENLCAHLRLQRSALRHVIAPLMHWHVIEYYETRVGERYALSEDGLRVMAAATHCHIRYLVHRPGTGDEPDPGTPLLIPRGVPGLLKQIEHIAGVYGFFDRLADLGCLRWWETGTICARFYQDQGSWHSIRPDAVAECQREQPEDHAHARPWRIWLEWDRGTMREGGLQRKMDAYARYLSAREWARESPTPPTLLCVVPDAGQERMLTRIARERLRTCSIRFAMHTTTRGLLITPGISAAIWRQVWPQREQTAETRVLLRLFPARTHASHEAAATRQKKEDQR